MEMAETSGQVRAPSSAGRVFGRAGDLAKQARKRALYTLDGNSPGGGAQGVSARGVSRMNAAQFKKFFTRPLRAFERIEMGSIS